MERTDSRPDSYRYFEMLKEHLGGDLSRAFNGDLIYPRQLEIHLPSNKVIPCNFDCFYCAGKRFQKDLGNFELTGLELLEKSGGKIPYHIYGGSYTEPLLNPYLMAYLAMTKETGAHFGIHTNGSILQRLEDDCGWLTELSRIAEDRVDYLSVSLDAGTAESHCQTKNISHDWFSEIMQGIETAAVRRSQSRGPAIRVCYLMNRFNSSDEEIRHIVDECRRIGTDSLRFSIPFGQYAQQFDAIRKYKRSVEDRFKDSYYRKVDPYLSKDQGEKPFIFWMGPEFQNVELFDFRHCVYGYYQICLAADGYFYRCTTISTPTFRDLRLGKATSSSEEFSDMIRRDQTLDFDCNECFRRGARCNRMGIEINRGWREWSESNRC